MFHLANCMRILSDQYGVVFVLTNQVTGDFDAARSTPRGTGLRPALGLSWSHCINQRYALISSLLDGGCRFVTPAVAIHCGAG